MNPMVFTILAWERELEIQRQAHEKHSYAPDVILPDDPERWRESSMSILARIPWIRRISWTRSITRMPGVRPQSPCECSQGASH